MRPTVRPTRARSALAKLCGGALLLAAGLLAGCDDAADSTAEEFFQQAREHYEQGEVAATIIELKNAIQKDAGHVRARILLGRAYTDVGDGVSAQKELERARDLGAAPEDYALPLARAYTLLGKFSEALNEIPHQEDLPQNEATERALVRGDAYIGLQKLDAAKQEFETIATADPNNNRALVGLGRVALLQGDTARARERAETVLARDPEYVPAIKLSADIALIERRFEDAEATYTALVEDAPAKPILRLPLAYSQIGQSKFDAANENLEVILKAFPNEPRANYLRALTAYQAQDYTAARARIDRAMQAAPNDLRVRLLAGAINYAAGQNELALRLLRNYLSDVPQDDRARRLLGATLLRIGNSEEALQVLKPLADTTVDDAEVLNMIGAAALQTGDAAGARTYFQRVATLQPDSGAALTQLGTVSLQSGDTEQAIEELEKALEQDPTLDRALAALVVARLRAGEMDKALEGAERFQEAYPDRAASATLLGIVRTARGELDEAREAFAEAMRRQPGAADAGVNLAILEYQRGEADPARDTLHEVLEKNPGHVQALQMLVELESEAGSTTDARPWLEKAVEQDPAAIEPRILLGRLLLQQNEPAEALAITEDQLIRYSNNPALREVVGRGQLALGRAADAVITFRPMAEGAPDSAPASFLLATALRAAGNRAGFRRQLEETLAIDPDHLEANVLLGNLLLQESKPEEADAIAARLQEKHGDSAQTLEFQGNIAAQQNRWAEAVAAYEAAAEQEPSSGLAIKIAVAQQRGGDTEGAIETLRAWGEAHPEDLATRFVLGIQFIGMGRLEESRDVFQQMVETSPENTTALNNLAWVQWQLGDLESAKAHAERAVQTAPSDPEVRDTLGVVLLARGEIDAALKHLRTAAEGVPDNAEVQFHYAQALARSGERERAREVLGKALESGRALGEREAAEELMRELEQ